MEVFLKDCNGVEVFRTLKGTSKIKDYKKSYYESMRKDFKSFETLKVNQKKINDPEEIITTIESKPSEINGGKNIDSKTTVRTNTIDETLDNNSTKSKKMKF